MQEVNELKKVLEVTQTKNTGELAKYMVDTIMGDESEEFKRKCEEKTAAALQIKELALADGKNEQYELTKDDMDALTTHLAVEATKNKNTQKLREILDGKREETATEIKTKDEVFMTEPKNIPESDVPVGSNTSNNTSYKQDISDEDAMVLYKISSRVKAGEDFDIYQELPEKIKYIVRSYANLYCVTGKLAFRRFAKMMVDELVHEIMVDKEFENLHKELQDTLNIPSVLDMFSEHNRETIEVSLVKKADELDSKGMHEAADLARRCVQAYIDSYTLNKQKDFIINNPNCIKQIRKNVIKKYKRFVESFDFILAKKYRSQSVDTLVPILTSLFDISDELAMKYVVILCQTCEKLDHNKQEDAWFMYNSVKNIVSLKFVNKSNPTEFTKLLMNNIKDLLQFISDKEDEDTSV